MDHLCTRCARLALRTGRVTSNAGPAQRIRRFSSSTYNLKDNQDSSTNSTSSSEPKSELPRRQPPPQSRLASLIEKTMPAPRNPNASSRPPGQAGQILRRTLPPRGSPPGAFDTSRSPGSGAQGNLLVRRQGGPRDGGIPPTLLRRNTRPPQTGGGGRGRDRSQSEEETKSKLQVRANRARRAGRPSTTPGSGADGNEAASEDVIEAYVKEVVDPPRNPTNWIPYNPTTPQMEELRKDWPATPLSPTGLTESVVQRIEWLARRLPHGYKTPEELAERYHAGELVRFESAEEKEEVLKIAGELAKKRADMLTDRKGEAVAMADMGLDDLSGRKMERNSLAETIVGGKYPEPEKQRTRFLDNTARILNNNSTYKSADMAKFIAKVESLLPAQKSENVQAAQKRT